MDTQLEQTLRQAPRPPAPAGLLDRLIADIQLPEPGLARTRHARSWSWPWLPKLAWVMGVFVCLAVIGSQTVQWRQLHQENQALQEATKDLAEVRKLNAEYQKLLWTQQELDRLRQDNAEVGNLRQEVQALRAQLQQLPQLRLQNQQLRQSLQAASPVATAVQGAVQEQKAKAERIACVNNLKQLGLAARIYGVDHQDTYPSDWLAMKAQIGTPKILVCPSDKAKSLPEAYGWDQFNPGMISYEFISPGLGFTNPSRVLFRCPIHNNVTLADGSVQQLDPKRFVIDYRRGVVVPVNPPAANGPGNVK